MLAVVSKQTVPAAYLASVLSGLFVLLTFSVFAGQNQSITLAWVPSQSVNVSGYHIYYGTASGYYTEKITVGDVTTANISDLLQGATYFFVVTAVDTLGQESVPSNEITYTVPGYLLTIRKVRTGGYSDAFRIRSTGVIPFAWVLQATRDFRAWTPVATGTNNATDVTVTVFGTPSLFFRLKNQ
jgi:hypothetical protein